MDEYEQACLDEIPDAEPDQTVVYVETQPEGETLEQLKERLLGPRPQIPEDASDDIVAYFEGLQQEYDERTKEQVFLRYEREQAQLIELDHKIKEQSSVAEEVKHVETVQDIVAEPDVKPLNLQGLTYTSDIKDVPVEVRMASLISIIQADPSEFMLYTFLKTRELMKNNNYAVKTQEECRDPDLKKFIKKTFNAQHSDNRNVIPLVRKVNSLCDEERIVTINYWARKMEPKNIEICQAPVQAVPVTIQTYYDDIYNINYLLISIMKGEMSHFFRRVYNNMCPALNDQFMICVQDLVNYFESIELVKKIEPDKFCFTHPTLNCSIVFKINERSIHITSEELDASVAIIDTGGLKTFDIRQMISLINAPRQIDVKTYEFYSRNQFKEFQETLNSLKYPYIAQNSYYHPDHKYAIALPVNRQNRFANLIQIRKLVNAHNHFNKQDLLTKLKTYITSFINVRGAYQKYDLRNWIYSKNLDGSLICHHCRKKDFSEIPTSGAFCNSLKQNCFYMNPLLLIKKGIMLDNINNQRVLKVHVFKCVFCLTKSIGQCTNSAHVANKNKFINAHKTDVSLNHKCADHEFLVFTSTKTMLTGNALYVNPDEHSLISEIVGTSKFLTDSKELAERYVLAVLKTKDEMIPLICAKCGRYNQVQQIFELYNDTIASSEYPESSAVELDINIKVMEEDNQPKSNKRKMPK